MAGTSEKVVNKTASKNKKLEIVNGNSSCAGIFHQVLSAAQKHKRSEFSLKRKSIEISDTLSKSIKKTKRSRPSKNLEFKSCFIELPRLNKQVVKKKQPKKSKLQVKMPPSKKPNAIKDTKVNIKPVNVITKKPVAATAKKTIRAIVKKASKSSSVASLIPIEVEHEINKYAQEAMNLRWSLMRKQLPYFIQHCINKRELDVFSNGLKMLANNLPSAAFVSTYMRKYKTVYKDLLEEKPSTCLTAMDEKNLFYFNLCWHLINQYAIKSESFLNRENKNRIFCCGDYSFTSDYKRILEITEGLATNNKKKGENVFFCVSATGKVFNPLVLNKGLTVKKYETSIYADNKYWQQASEDGMMGSEAFHLWLITSFRPHLMEENIQRPVILFFNSDAPYLSIPVLDFCKENEIILFSIPAQFASLVNPMDMSCFDALSMEYCQIFRKRAEESVGKAKEFCPLILIAAMDRINFNSCAQSAFEVSGLLKKESYSLTNKPTKKKSSQFNIEDRLPSFVKNDSYELGKQVGKLNCYQEMLSTSALDLTSLNTTDAEKRFFNRIKRLYLEQSEKCTEMLDCYDDSSQDTCEQKVRIRTSSVNSRMGLNAENILRIKSPQKINTNYDKNNRDLSVI